MAVSAFQSAILGELMSDNEVAPLFSDDAEIAAMIRFESALARVEGALGVIPADAAKAIEDGLANAKLDPAALAAGTASAGVSVPAFVAALRDMLPPGAETYVHWGATSQDVLDTALVLRIRDAMALLQARLFGICDRLAGLSDTHRHTVMAARTRSQQATLTSFGLKCSVWLDPLVRQIGRAEEMKPRLFAVQFGGASGNLGALGCAGHRVLEELARELNLAPASPWHASRDRLVELANWLTTTTGSLGKFGGDLTLLVQSEVAEVRLGATGGSSTMPQKQNPVGPEALVALARFNAVQIGALHQANLHNHERDGAAWALEWMALPQMIVATATALRHTQTILDGLAPDADRMRANIDRSNGLMLAEAASFALTAHMSRAEAQQLVKTAARSALADNRHLADCLADETDVTIDWAALKLPDAHLGAADEFIDATRANFRAFRSIGCDD